MVNIKSTIVLALAALAAANPVPAAGSDAALAKRQGTSSLDAVRCADARYSRRQVEEATAEGCRLHAAKETLGNSKYPHTFNNRESLVFAASGPYQEFPIIASGNYTGRAPGADRIVFNPNYQSRGCVYVGTMTHTGAPTRNGFVLCNETTTSGSSSSDGNGTSAAVGVSASGPLAVVLPVLSFLALAA
ncbi:guanyl-specific ribonuclease N1 [Colletotrichum musicola]|uniref:Guanyl-specific ribonuclease N1 n=1 Tax=Colletotrichum musicola TaxID=2175873 RepID=A0A8H6K4J7_9PEZI|nr:guanyl-specific ribonuclease N1 [Colletotrichum musicola]